MGQKRRFRPCHPCPLYPESGHHSARWRCPLVATGDQSAAQQNSVGTFWLVAAQTIMPMTIALLGEMQEDATRANDGRNRKSSSSQCAE